ncbi:MAG: acyltransferase, partial [Bacteroidota bacterium]
MSNAARISSLDGVRGLATVMVLTGHFLFADVYRNQWWFEMAHSGWLGVDLFFVLSGFLITGILLKSKGKPHYFREFYRRRFLRIFPLYYAVIIYAALAIVLIDRAPEHLWKGYDSLGWFLAFIPNFALAFKNDWLWQTNWAGLNHLWSLAVEEQFYMFWPLIVWIMPRKLLGVSCAVLLCVGVVSRQLTDHVYGTLWSMGSYVLPFCRMDGLAGGSLLAILLHTNKIKLGGFEQAIIRDITFLCFMGLFYWLVAENSHWRGTIAAFTFVGFTYLALCEEGIVRRICELKFLR